MKIFGSVLKYVKLRRCLGENLNCKLYFP